MNQRVRAVRQQNLDLFLRRVDHSDKALMARQRRYFRNLVQLPLAKLRFRVMDEEWQGLRTPKRWGAEVHIPRVRQVIQLEDVRRGPGRARRRPGVLLPQGTRADRLGPDRRREDALRGNPRAVGPDSGHRP